MPNLNLYRKRIFPNECILLKDDEVLKISNDVIITKWNALKPKKELHHGFSCYYLNENFKMSMFLDSDNQLLYWYFDIIEYEYQAENSTYIFTDLLVDVQIQPDGFVKVLDLDELVAAFDSRLITDYQLKKALLSLNNLLSAIYTPKLSELKLTLQRYYEKA